MRRHLAIALISLLALAPGCKSLGGAMSGLGRGLGHVASGAARGVAHAGGAVAQGVARTTPAVLQASEAVVETAIEVALTTPPEIVIEAAPPPPLSLQSADPCQTCPFDNDCGACAGYAGYACLASPAGAPARCESSAPPDAPPAPQVSAPDPASI